MDQRGTRIPFGELASLQRATALGRIDFWVVKGWDAPEELLYPQVQEALTAWTRANRPRHEVLRVVGERWSPRSHELRDALSRNTIPFGFYTPDSDEGRRFLRDHGVDANRLPAVILHDGSVLHEPTLVDVAEALGVQTHPSSEVYDLAILGAGPAGLSAAVYGASEGLRTLVVEPQAIGGQAGTELADPQLPRLPAGRRRRRAGPPRVGASPALRGPVRVHPAGDRADGARRRASRSRCPTGARSIARAVIVAAGVDYRRLGIPALDRLSGRASSMARRASRRRRWPGEEVYVVGGANSAGQAALHLARFAARVTLLVRGDSLASGMSDYLITQIEATPNVDVRLGTRVVDGGGEARLEALTLEDVGTGRREQVAAAAIFVLIGAEPRTEWLRDSSSATTADSS